MNTLFHALCRYLFASKRQHVWRTWGWIAVLLLLTYLYGPMLLYLWGQDRPKTSSSFSSWLASVEGAAVCLLCYLPLWLLHQQLAFFWSSLFVLLAQVSHRTLLTQFGSTSFWPPTPANLLWRWMTVLPATGVVALLLTHIPMFHASVTNQTSHAPQRVLTSKEAQLVAMTRSVQKIQRRQRQHIPSVVCTPALRPSEHPFQRTSVTLASDSFLPSSSDALEESADGKRGAGTHLMLVAAQQDASSRSITSGSASPLLQQNDDDEYDWSQGEGTIREHVVQKRKEATDHAD